MTTLGVSAAAVCVSCGGELAGDGPCPGCGAVGTPPPAANMRGRVMRSSAWTAGGFVAGQVLRFASNLILAHLLVPADFGIMTLVAAFMQGLQMFSDIGIGPSIIQHKRGEDPVFLHTAWTVQVIRGLLLALVAALLAYPLARIYQTPELLWVLPVVGLNSILAGFNSTALFTLNRRLMLGRFTLLNLGSYLASTIVTVVWAVISPSVWALVAGGLASNIIYLAASYTLLGGHRDRFAWDRECLRSLLTFGRWIFLSTVLTFLVGQGDRLIFGKMIPMAVLGVYSLALTLATFSSQAVLSLGGSVLFPAYSERLRSGGELGPVFNKVRNPLAVFAGYTVAGVIAAGPTLIDLIYPNTFGQAGWMVQPLAAAGLLQALECTNGAALLALGQARWVAAGNAAKLVGMLVLIPVGYHFWQFPGAVGGLVASELLRYGVSVSGVSWYGLPAFSRDIVICAWAAATAAAGILLGDWLAARGVGGWERLFIQSAAVTVLWLPALWRLAGVVRGRS